MCIVGLVLYWVVYLLVGVLFDCVWNLYWFGLLKVLIVVDGILLFGWLYLVFEFEMMVWEVCFVCNDCWLGMFYLSGEVECNGLIVMLMFLWVF